MTKKTCQALFILAVATNILTVINAGIAIVGGIGSAIPAGSVGGQSVFNLSNDGLLEIASKWAVSIGESIFLAADGIAQVTTGRLVEGLAHLYGGKDLVDIKDKKKNIGSIEEEVSINKGLIRFTEKQLQMKFKHAAKFGVKDSWNKHASAKYRQALVNFINSEKTEVMKAFYRREPAIFYINKKTRLFVVEVGGKYCSGWKLDLVQFKNFMRSGNVTSSRG